MTEVTGRSAVILEPMRSHLDPAAPRVFHRLVAPALLCGALVLGGCSGDDGEPRPEPITLASEGIEWPVVDRDDPHAFSFPDLPDRPASIDEDEWAAAGDTLRAWAVEASFVDHGDAAFEAIAARVFDALPEATRTDVRDRVAAGAAPRLGAATVVAGEIDETRATAAWHVSQFEDDGEVVRLTLQTRTALQVTSERGGEDRTEVVGVVRSVGLNLRPGRTPGAWLVWEEFGADDCSLAEQDALVPATDLEAERSALRDFVALGDTKGHARVEAGPVVDEEFRETCENSTT